MSTPDGTRGRHERIDVSFPSGDASCAAWLYLPDPGGADPGGADPGGADPGGADPGGRNGVAARLALHVPRYRPGRRLHELRCPVLLCLSSDDSVTPTARTRRYAAGTRAQIREYPFGHFAVYAGPEGQVVLHDQLEFLRREVPPTGSPA